MKLLISYLTLLLFLGCQKERSERNTTLVGLTFTQTNTPDAATMESGIVSAVKCYGSDLCYRFAGFEITESGTRQVDIRAVATYPAGNNVVCAQALYQVDTTVRHNPITTGQYILRFYNGNTLFDADTVQVN